MVKRRVSSALCDSEAGFSLIELAVVLIIVGLIIGGVLKGQELLEGARLNSVLTQLNEFRLATHTFQDRYGALPGNYAEASRHIHPDLKDGSGGGIITGDGLDPRSEAGQFWQHLARADLIPLSLLKNDRMAFGDTAPSAKVGGGFTIAHAPHPDLHGHWIVLGEESGARGDGALLTPLQAMSLDLKADTGHPSTGKVRAKNGTGHYAGKCLAQDGSYNTKNLKKSCVLYFQF